MGEKKTEGEVSVTSHRGNTIRKSADLDDPAITIERFGNDVVKKASEVEVDEKASKNKKGGKKSATPAKKGAAADKEEKANGAKAGRKRAHEETVEEEEEGEGDEEDAEADDEPAAKRGRGRPKAGGSASKPAAKTGGTGKRGRPPTGRTVVEKPKVIGPDGKPRGRGRPPKDPSAPKKAAAKSPKKKTPTAGTRKSSRTQG